MIFIYKNEFVTDTLVEITGSFLTSIAINNFALNAGFPMTGFSGIALILYRLFGLPIGIMTILLNIPVALACYRLIGKTFMLKTLRCMIISSIMVDHIAPLFPSYTGNVMLCALMTGVLGGIGYALIYMRGSSTGGIDFIIMSAKVLHPHLNLGTIVFLADLIIIFLGGFIFKDIDGIIYGIIITYLHAVVVDKVQYGLNSGKFALIVTNKGRLVCDIINESAGRGSTIIPARGGYHHEARDIVMVACSSKEMYIIEKAIKETLGSDTFIIIINSYEIHGEGFKIFGL